MLILLEITQQKWSLEQLLYLIYHNKLYEQLYELYYRVNVGENISLLILTITFWKSSVVNVLQALVHIYHVVHMMYINGNKIQDSKIQNVHFEKHTITMGIYTKIWSYSWYFLIINIKG